MYVIAEREKKEKMHTNKSDFTVSLRSFVFMSMHFWLENNERIERAAEKKNECVQVYCAGAHMGNEKRMIQFKVKQLISSMISYTHNRRNTQWQCHWCVHVVANFNGKYSENASCNNSKQLDSEWSVIQHKISNSAELN